MEEWQPVESQDDLLVRKNTREQWKPLVALGQRLYRYIVEYGVDIMSASTKCTIV